MQLIRINDLMVHKMKKLLPAGPGSVGGASGVALLAQFTDFGSQLDSIDKFLDAGLFMTLMGISIAAGGLLSAAADQKRNLANTTFLSDQEKFRSNPELLLQVTGKLQEALKEANSISVGASYFLLAFLPALLGLFSCVAFDAIFETNPGYSKEVMSGLVELFSGSLKEELSEALFSGAFLGANLLMMLQGFLSAKYAFKIN